MKRKKGDGMENEHSIFVERAKHAVGLDYKIHITGTEKRSISLIEISIARQKMMGYGAF